MAFDNNYFRYNKPSVFISYSWDSPEHQGWVREFAERLKRETGCRLVFDQDLMHVEDQVLRVGDKQNVFMQLAEVVDYVIAIWTDGYLEKVGLAAEKVTGALQEHLHLMTRVKAKYGDERIIPIYRQPRGGHRNPGGLFDGIHGLVMPSEERGLNRFDAGFEELRRVIKPRHDPLPPVAFRREHLELKRVTGIDASTEAILEQLGKASGDNYLYANEDIRYRLRWAPDRSAIIADVEQLYEVVNLKKVAVPREAFWDYAVSYDFELRSYEAWGYDNSVLSNHHFASNPLKRTPDGARMYYAAPTVQIPPLSADGRGRIYCRARWRVGSRLANVESLRSLKYAAFNVRIQIVEAADDIAVTVSGLPTAEDKERRIYLFETMIRPGDTIEVSWNPK